MSLVAVISDIHACAEDLSAVLSEIDRHQADHIWCLGDFASGGPDPLACYEMVALRCDLILGGNHELFVAAKAWENSQEDWAKWAEHAFNQLGVERSEILMMLPTHLEGENLQLVHGSLRDPLWEFISSEATAKQQWPLMSSDFLFFGHTHKRAFWLQEGQQKIETGQWTALSPKAMLNPGPVAQKRQWLLLETDLEDLPMRAKWMEA